MGGRMAPPATKPTAYQAPVPIAWRERDGLIGIICGR